mgnify:CR=1 FL=1
MAVSRRPFTAAVMSKTMTITMTVTVLLLTLTAATDFSYPNPFPNLYPNINPKPNPNPSPSPDAMERSQRSLVDYTCWNCDDSPYVRDPHHYHLGPPGLESNDQAKFSALPDMAAAAHHMPMPMPRAMPMAMPHAPMTSSQQQEKGRGAPH